MILQKIKNKEARIGVIGLGYVGLPLVIEFCKAGFPVTGFDIDQKKIQQLACGESYIKHIPAEDIQSFITEKQFRGSTDFTLISEMDCILICVPTPLNKNRDPDISFITSTAKCIAPYLAKNQLVVLESTTYPGTTAEILVPELENGSGLKGDIDFFVAYSPEREDPNNRQYNTATIPKVVGANTPRSSDIANVLYSAIIEKIVPVSSTQVAEATKLMENIFRAVNIALVNELKVVFDKMGIDVWEVIEAASTKPFGYMPFYPGPGLGGHCIPIDPFYLTWKAREYGASTRFIELAGEVNVSMPDYVIQKIMIALSEAEKSVKNSKILVLGLAYKKDVDDARESVSFKIMEQLGELGAIVEYNDPYIPLIGDKRDYPQFSGKKSVPLTDLGLFDLAVILTDHSAYNYEEIAKDSKLLIDTRNACGKIQSSKITKA